MNITEKNLLAILWNKLGFMTQKELAEKYGVSTAFLNDVVHGRRKITAKFAESMGYQRIVVYERIKTK
jgi:plasmid maintenance system antidote protein VapI